MGRETRATWAARVARWTSSGLTAAAFAARERINPRTLTYWRWRLRADGATALPSPRRAAPFVEVVVPEVARDTTALTRIATMATTSPPTSTTTATSNTSITTTVPMTTAFRAAGAQCTGLPGHGEPRTTEWERSIR
jgi:hypothetical protein